MVRACVVPGVFQLAGIARIPVLHDFDPATETPLHLALQLREISRFHDVRHFFLLFAAVVYHPSLHWFQKPLLEHFGISELLIEFAERHYQNGAIEPLHLPRPEPLMRNQHPRLDLQLAVVDVFVGLL